MGQKNFRWRWLVAAGLVGALTIAVFNFDALILGAAVLVGDKRPTLLRDAGWDDPGSASQFNQRFVAGSDEALLERWLEDNRFTIDRASGRAHRLIESLPCGETVDVSWRSDKGQLQGAAVTVREAGCL